MPKPIQPIKTFFIKQRRLIIRGLLIVGAIVAGFFIVFGALILFVRSIGNSFSCDYFHIDNTEIIAQIDIPDVEDGFNCQYEKNGPRQIKSTLYVLDKSIERKHYIAHSNFKKVTDTDRLIFHHQDEWNKAINNIRNTTVLYVNHGSYTIENSYEWLYVLDTAKGTMWTQVIKITKKQ